MEKGVTDQRMKGRWWELGEVGVYLHADKIESIRQILRGTGE